MSVIYAEALDHSTNVFLHPTYRWSKSLPMNGNQGAEIPLSSNYSMQFELPTNNQVVNLSRTKLCFNYEMVTSGANKQNLIHSHPLCLIESINLATRQGLRLVDINNVAQYSRLVQRIVTPIESLSSGPRGEACEDIAHSVLTPIRGLQAAMTTPAALATVRAENYFIQNIGTDTRLGIPLASFNECNHFIPVPTNKATAITFMMDFNELYGTLLSVDKDIFYGQSLILTINFAPTSQHGALATKGAATTFYTVFEALPVATLSAICLYNALETNPAIIQRLMSAPTDQIIPFIMTNVMATSLSTQSSFVVRVNGLQGKCIARYFYGAFVAAVGGPSTLLCNNSGSSMIQSYYTAVDGNRDTDFPVSIANSDHYMVNMDKLTGSCIQSIAEYNTVFCHVQDWTGIPPCRDNGTMLNGLALDRERQLSMNIVTPSTTLRQFMFIELRRRLVINNGIITLE